jgi:hypothetical protein
MWELLVHDHEDAEECLVDEPNKRSWLNKTLMTCKKFGTILQTIDTTETTMLALQGASGNRVSRLPWSIWLATLKDEANKLDKKKESRSKYQCMNHNTSITPARGRSGRGGCHGRGGGSGRGRGSSNRSSTRVPTMVTSGMQFTNQMTFIPEEYANVTDAQRASLNVLVKWEDGYETYEALDIIVKDDPITVAQYAEDHGLLETAGWKKLKRFVKNKKPFARMVKQAKLTSQRHGPIYQFGIQVPRNVKEALAFDETNATICGRKPWRLS